MGSTIQRERLYKISKTGENYRELIGAVNKGEKKDHGKTEK